MNYLRVLPRDLFNESKLLKCLGRLTLLIHDGEIDGLNFCLERDEVGFEIVQEKSDGSIFVRNLYFFDSSLTPLSHYTSMNAREKYPLILLYKGEEYYPFNEDGEYQLDKNLFLLKEK